MIECIAVGLGGFIGSVCRYLIGLIPVNENAVFPLKTFIINIFGSFLIGAITAAALKNRDLDPRLALETEDLIKQGNLGTCILYGVLSVVLGICAVFAGEILTNQLTI